MADAEDYYYRAKPADRIALRAALSPEARGYASTYEDQMHLRGQALPDERTPSGMDWHKTVMGVRSARSIARAVRELLDKGWLVRLQDGRLINGEVERERAHRLAMKKPRGGTGGRGGGQEGGGPPRQGVLEVIDGGRSPPPTVGNPVDEAGRTGDGPGEVADCRPIRGRFPVKLAEIVQRNQGAASLKYRERKHHEVVVAVPFEAARARDGPTSRQA